MDINKMYLTGVVETAPVLSSLPGSKTPVCYFTLRVDERFMTDNTLALRPNYFRIESLGKQAKFTYEKVVVGGRYLIDGYLRQENSNPNKIDVVKVRSYGVIPDITTSAMHYREGLKQALRILSFHEDHKDSVKAIKEILKTDLKDYL